VIEAETLGGHQVIWSTDMRVVIIGAGAAGLAAARSLCAAGISVVILEARDRTGGRIHTVRDPALDVPVELGAEFVHGKPPSVFEIAETARLPLEEMADRHEFWQDGKPTRRPDLFQRTDKIFDRLADPRLSDETFADFLAEIDAGEDARQMAANYVEGFDAARLDRIGTKALAQEKAAEDAIEGDRAFRFPRGYDGLVDYLGQECRSSGAELHRRTVATGVEWQRGRVRVSAVAVVYAPPEKSEIKFTADRAIITVPLGVLKTSDESPGALRINPRPPHLDLALGCLETGHAARVTLRFRPGFREENSGLIESKFIHSNDGAFPTWWTPLTPLPSMVVPALTGWSGGPKAERLARLSDAQLADRAIESLGRILALDANATRRSVEACYVHNWSADSFARGAYSYAGIGGIEARRRLAEPVENTLYFAGEALSTDGHASTVHGAVESGQLAATQVIEGMGRGW
jgi:monoamine oxidase